MDEVKKLLYRGKGSPRKLSPERTRELTVRFLDPNANRTALAKEYGLTYQGARFVVMRDIKEHGVPGGGQ